MARRGKRRKGKGKRKSQQATPGETEATTADKAAGDNADKAAGDNADKTETTDATDKAAADDKPSADKGKHTAELDTGWDDDGMGLPEVKSATHPVVKPSVKAAKESEAKEPAAKQPDKKSAARESEAKEPDKKSAAKQPDKKSAAKEPDKKSAAEKPAPKPRVDPDDDDDETAIAAARTVKDDLADDDDVFPPRNEPAPVPALRAFDNALGIAEQAILCVLLIGLIGTATYSAVMGNLFNEGVDWAATIIQYSVFYIAMIGAALAAQRQRMITMDILTRLLSDHSKAYLRAAIALLVIFVCYLLIDGGMASRANEAKYTTSDEIISVANGILALPIGAALIGLHYLIHLFIDIRYLSLGKTPPQPKGMQVH